MKNLFFIFLIFFFNSSFNLFSQKDFEGDWYFCALKEKEFDLYNLNNPFKDDIRESNDWLSF